jgi:hypothetical protein
VCTEDVNYPLRFSEWVQRPDKYEEMFLSGIYDIHLAYFYKLALVFLADSR